jgi:hypothetical protein
MMKKESGQMMVMLLPEHIMGALKGGDEPPSGDGEPVEDEGEAEMEDKGPMGKGKMGKACPVCGRH